MQTRDYLRYIVEGIHSVVFATVDSMGRPVTCAIDIIDVYKRQVCYKDL